MGFVQDSQDQAQSSGFTGAGLPPALRNRLAAANAGLLADSVIDPAIDAAWANSYSQTRAIHSYFDYYFTGQDIQIYIDGIEKPNPEAELPILSFGFNVQQQKQPVYGFWDYTYAAMMRGTRIVNGQFTIATLSTDYMARLVSAAAAVRSGQIKGHKTNYVIRGMDIDETNINKYWTRNINDDTAYSNGKHLFSSHPPFNFVILYGIQSSSITGDGTAKLNEALKAYRHDTPLMTDINERLVSTNSDNAMRFVIENVELMNMQVEYLPDGRVCSETYSFCARDLTTPKLDHNYTKFDVLNLPPSPF